MLVAGPDAVRLEIAREEVGELVALVALARHLDDRPVAIPGQQRQGVGAARAPPGEQRPGADVGIGDDQDGAPAVEDRLLGQLRRNRRPFLGLAEDHEVEGPRDLDEPMEDLVVAAAIEVDECGASAERGAPASNAWRADSIASRLGLAAEGGPR
jgi:hypothetical protein